MADFIRARVREIELNRAEILRIVGRQTIKAITKAALAVEAEAKRLVSGPSPSAEGAPPGLRTGSLRASITHSIEEEGKKVRAFVGTDIEYGAYLELGTRKMAARPFMNPALRNVMRRHQDWFR